MTTQPDITNLITSLFPLDSQIEHIKSHTNRAGGTVLPAMKDDGTMYHQRLRRPIAPLNLNFVTDKDESLEWEKRVIGYIDILKHRPVDKQSLDFHMIPGLGSLALGLFHAADKKDNTNVNILLPKEDTGFVSYYQEDDVLYFVVEYSFS